jgi:hypothetical protein
VAAATGKRFPSPRPGDNQKPDMGIDAFCFLITGVHTQVPLKQLGAEVGKPGASVKVCYKTFEFIYTIYSIQLVRQSPQPWVEWIGMIHPEDNETIYTQNFPGSLTLTVDMSSSIEFMELSRLRAVDPSVYYCAR